MKDHQDYGEGALDRIDNDIDRPIILFAIRQLYVF